MLKERIYVGVGCFRDSRQEESSLTPTRSAAFPHRSVTELCSMSGGVLFIHSVNFSHNMFLFSLSSFILFDFTKTKEDCPLSYHILGFPRRTSPFVPCSPRSLLIMTSATQPKASLFSSEAPRICSFLSNLTKTHVRSHFLSAEHASLNMASFTHRRYCL